MDFGEEDVTAFDRWFSGECDDEAASFAVGVEEVAGGEVVVEDVERR